MIAFGTEMTSAIYTEQRLEFQRQFMTNLRIAKTMKRSGFVRIRQHIGNVDIHIDTKRIDRNMKEAQKLLNLAVRTDCEPLVPLMNGQLRRSATFPEGVYGGVLEYNTPYAHYLYEGRVYGPNIPIKDSEGNITGWFSPPGQAKHPTGKKIQYHEPGTADHWFEKAKERHGDKWLRLVREEAGKG